MLDVRVCGGVEVRSDGRLLPDSLIGGRQGRLVLAYLVCERDRAIRREELAELLWNEQLPDSWAASLSAVISRLRRLFTEAGLDGTAVVASAPGSYQLHLPADSRVDLEELIAAVADAEEPGDVDRALAAAGAPKRSPVAASSGTTANGWTAVASQSATCGYGRRSRSPRRTTVRVRLLAPSNRPGERWSSTRRRKRRTANS